MIDFLPIKFNLADFQQGHNYCLALSGGVDSVVLLHLTYKFMQENNINLNQLQALHINHNISQFSNTWQQFCQNYCQQLGIQLTIVNVRVSNSKGLGLENSARKLRYKAFAEIHGVDFLMLAHHLDDQYETMLSQMMRGSDLHNVAAMNECRRFAGKWLYRPLLCCSKKSILDYANVNNLHYVVDDSNSDNSLLRNFLRNIIIPKLQSYDNNLYNKFSTYLASVKTYVALADELAASDLANCCSYGHKNIIECNLISSLTTIRQSNLLSYFIKQQIGVSISHKSIREFIKQCCNVNNNLLGAKPALTIGSKKIICQHQQISIVDKS